MLNPPVLLIALALLPLSAGLKCYVGTSAFHPNGTVNAEATVEKNETVCAETVSNCYWAYGSSERGYGDEWTCDDEGKCPPRTENKTVDCGSGTTNGTNAANEQISASYEDCCCKGDLCNTFEWTTSVPPTTTTPAPAPITPMVLPPFSDDVYGPNPATGPTSWFAAAVAAAAVTAARV